MKMNDTDLELLRRYARRNAEDAFAQLVRRHLNLVFCAALRQVRSPELAEEVAQSVFTDLARQAERLAPNTILAAWLYQVTRRTAIDVVRREARRRLREQVAIELTAMNATPADWTEIEPLLDEAMHALDDTDRTAVLLRYFENKSLREVGRMLDTTEDAARKRLSRAVERLREFFTKRGVTVGASGLVIAISANAVQGAPVGLAVSISSAAAVTGTAVSTSTMIPAVKTIAMTTFQKVFITTTLAAAVGTAIYQARQNSTLASQTQTLQQRQALQSDQIQQLQIERDDATSKASALLAENEQLRARAAEVAKLRGNLGRLKAGSLATGNDPGLEGAFKALATRATQLRQRLEQMPDKKIPELQLLAEKDWFDAVKNIDQLETDADFRLAFNQLRTIAKSDFAGMTEKALGAYLQANGGQLPADLSQLMPYFQTPVDEAILQRYSLLQTGKLSEAAAGQYLVAETAPPVDDTYDTAFRISLNGTLTTSFSQNAIENAALQYAQANNGLLPTDPSQLAPYLKQPIDPAETQKFLNRVPPGVTTLDQLNALHKTM
jgi:RNA polymerase sigma factor (sigma-70 family)